MTDIQDLELLPTEYEDCLLPLVTSGEMTGPGGIALDGDPRDWPVAERPLIYVASYYTANPLHGTHNAIMWAEKLAEVGWLPYVPHSASMTYDLVFPHTPEWWYQYDLALLARMDAIFICPDPLTGESSGVMKELAYAAKNDMPIFHEVVEAKDRYRV